MVKLIKAIPLGALLSWLVSTLVGAAGSTGGVLQIQHVLVRGADLYGSWPLFALGTLLAWAILSMMA